MVTHPMKCGEHRQGSPAHRRRFTRSVVLAFLVTAASATALGPHEILLLVNSASVDSLTIANHFIALRGIPLSNVVYLDLPENLSDSDLEMTPDEFTRTIWNPAETALRKRGLSDHVLAWIFSAGFPVRIATSPPMSLHGLVFSGNIPPDEEAIRTGQFPSPLFRGPIGPDAPVGPSATLETMNAVLGTRMPRVSMTLAHTGQRGLTRAQAVALLHRSAEADATRPEGTVYFVVSDDVRSQARAWQYEGAITELNALGVHAVETDTFPAGAEDVIGLLTGDARPDPSQIAAFIPGAMAEHLTSWAATFDRPQQTKVTAWFKAGATASAGTVTEPLSVWTKFPSARFFAHYARGCTLLESFAQSVASPVQILYLGDPLTAPWKPDIAVDIQPVRAGDAHPVFQARLSPPGQADYVFFIDGRRVTPLVPEPVVRWNPGLLGNRRLRAVAYLRGGPVRHQAFAEIEVEHPFPGRSVHLLPQEDCDTYESTTPIHFHLQSEGAPTRIRVLAQGREIETVEHETSASLVVHPAHVGAGPVIFQAVADYPDGLSLPGPPLTLIIHDAGFPDGAESADEPAAQVPEDSEREEAAP